MSTVPVDAQALTAVSLFESCDKGTLAELQRVLKHKAYCKGDEIVKVGLFCEQSDSIST